MLKCITRCLLAMVMVLSLVACGSSESKDDNSSIPTPEDLGLQPTNTNYTRDFDSTTNQTITFGDVMFQIPKGWSTGDSTVEENLSEIPEKSALDDIIDNALSTIGVERVEYRAYGNYDDLGPGAAMTDVFVITDANKSLMVNALFTSYSKKWSILSISDANDNRYYYVPSDASATVDIYDYKTGELVSKQSMTHEELDEELKKQEEEAEKKYQEEIDKLLDNYGLKTSDTTDIAVRFETDYIDGDRLHITVFTKNNSEEVFAGNVYVTFYSADGKDRLGSDTIIVDELLPGRESWADIIVDAYRGTPKMTVDFSGVSFTPIKEVVSEIDLDATEKTKSSYYWNFDGVSWYNDITDIAVYENGTCVVVLKDNPKEGGQFYASTIWSCGNDHGVDTVQVIDKDGTILSVYGDGDMISVTPNSSGKITSSVDIPSSDTTFSQETTSPNNTDTSSNSNEREPNETVAYVPSDDMNEFLVRFILPQYVNVNGKHTDPVEHDSNESTDWCYKLEGKVGADIYEAMVYPFCDINNNVEDLWIRYLYWNGELIIENDPSEQIHYSPKKYW